MSMIRKLGWQVGMRCTTGRDNQNSTHCPVVKGLKVSDADAPISGDLFAAQENLDI